MLLAPGVGAETFGGTGEHLRGQHITGVGQFLLFLVFLCLSFCWMEYFIIRGLRTFFMLTFQTGRRAGMEIKASK